MIIFVVVLAVFNQSGVLLQCVYLGMSANDVFRHRNRPRHPKGFPSKKTSDTHGHGHDMPRARPMTWLIFP